MTAEHRSDMAVPARERFADATTTFAGFLLVIASSFDIIQGLSAVHNDTLYTTDKQYLYEIDLTAWGWIHIGVGVLGVLIAVGIFRRARWGQVAGLAVATVSILTNFAFLPVYPVWSGFIIAFSAGVAWALYVQLEVHPGPDVRPRPVRDLQDYRLEADDP